MIPMGGLYRVKVYLEWSGHIVHPKRSVLRLLKGMQGKIMFFGFVLLVEVMVGPFAILLFFLCVPIVYQCFGQTKLLIDQGEMHSGIYIC